MPFAMLEIEDIPQTRVSMMRRTSIPRLCTIDGCDGELRCSGMCAAHYQRWLRGVPVVVVIKRRTRRYS